MTGLPLLSRSETRNIASKAECSLRRVGEKGLCSRRTCVVKSWTSAAGALMYNLPIVAEVSGRPPIYRRGRRSTDVARSRGVG